MLPPGRYVLTVKKPGFFDEVRSVDIDPRGRHRLAINLRPEMAILTLSSNIADADIEIEQAGKFRGPLRRQFLKPGRYRINVTRRGYVSQTVTADLRQAGKEQNIYVVLEPLRIETVLNQAEALLNKGDLERASLLLNDVLAMNPAYARANLLYGFIELRRGNPSSAIYFLKAITGGETVSIPVKTVFANELTGVQIAISRDAIAFRSDARADLNFRIARSKLEELSHSDGSGLPNYLAVKGESDFFGRGIRPNLKIFSASAAMGVTGGIVCESLPSAASCASDVEILFEVISKWREMGSAASAK